MKLIDICADILLSPYGLDHKDLPPRLPSAADLDAVAEEQSIQERTQPHENPDPAAVGEHRV